jgi:2-oxoglutarate ferredoxin oxidoreductase subunit gamma
MQDYNIMLAGFGGQGVLFAGKLLAYAGMLDGHELSWLPSYGPEMRGGTANCSVVISEDPIGSPLVTEPNVLIAMNLPSFDKFVDTVEPGGIVIVDKTLVDACPTRDDITFVAIPATQLAEEHGLKTLANVILVGKILQITGFSTIATLEAAIDKSVSAKHLDLVDANKKALRLGFEWNEGNDCR